MNYKKIIDQAQAGTFIIGEAGVNHNGSLSLAKELVDVAVEAGCDAVKFQTWITEKVYCKTLSLKPEYQCRTTDKTESEYETIKKLELSFEAFREIKAYCDKQGILFLSTPDEADSADFLVSLGVRLMKIASQDVTNIPFLRDLARRRIPLIYSTGACTLHEMIEGAEAILQENQELIILHCVSAYPAPLEDLNLRFISVLAKLFACPIGFSDHTMGINAACAALALGARVFEKHFTLGRRFEGPDHQASLEPDELKTYVATLRNMLNALGDGKKRIMPCELENSKAFRRYLVTERAIRKGEVLREEDFIFKKTVNGIEPRFLDQIKGALARHDLPADVPLAWQHLEFNA